MGQGRENYFAYGGLMLQENIGCALERPPSSTRARLPGYARYRVGRSCLPGVREVAHTATDGVLYRGLNADQLACLDEWQGPLFARRAVRMVAQGDEIVSGVTHVVVDGFRGQMSREPWDYELLLRVYSQCDTGLGAGTIFFKPMRAC